MREAIASIAVATGASAIVMAAVLGAVDFGFVILVTVLVSLVVWIGTKMRTPKEDWLPTIVVTAFTAKLIASWARWWVLVNLYSGSGDAAGYHGRALVYVDFLRELQRPPISGFGEGTRFVWWATTIIYLPYKPSMLGGFLIFATIAFLGTMLMFAAYRRAFPDTDTKPYALVLFFMPSILFWPASIGKEALMFLFLGWIAYGGARLYERYSPLWLVWMGVGAWFAVELRVHVAALIIGSITVAALWAKTPPVRGALARRVAIGMIAIVGVAGLVALTAEEFGIVVTTDEFEVDPFLDRVERQTGGGGSAVEGDAITSIAEVPSGVWRVLFRPMVWEASNEQALLSAVESAVLLLIVLWRLPAIVRSLKRGRARPYLVMCFVYTVGFIVAWSSFLNLGLLARQRSQLWPFFLVLLIAPGGESMAKLRRKRGRLPAPDPNAELEPVS